MVLAESIFQFEGDASINSGILIEEFKNNKEPIYANRGGSGD